MNIKNIFKKVMKLAGYDVKYSALYKPDEERAIVIQLTKRK